MTKFMTLVYILIINCLVLASAGAVTIGPYNIISDLPGFNATNSMGPIKGSDGVDHVSYMVGFVEGDSTTPSDNARRFSVDITKFSLPIDMGNKDLLAQAYTDTVNNVYPGINWDVKDLVMIDGCLAAHSQNITDGIDFICYFLNSNEKVTIGARNLTSEEFTVLLRNFHVQKM